MLSIIIMELQDIVWCDLFFHTGDIVNKDINHFSDQNEM